MINKLEYIVRQLGRTNKKNYENYVVTGIWHLLNNPDLKFTTQQYVARPNGRAFTDMYFPQLSCHLEIDEPHHEKQKVDDTSREKDIIDITSHRIDRIKITKDIKFINLQIHKIVEIINDLVNLKKQQGKFEEWNLEKEFDPKFYKRIGIITLEEGATFRRIKDACNCFGHNYKGFQQGWTVNKLNPKQYLWFPKFYENDTWNNWITKDGLQITEQSKNQENASEHFQMVFKKNVDRVVFARAKDNLGFVLYRFKGVFRLNEKISNPVSGLKYDRIATKVFTG